MACRNSRQQVGDNVFYFIGMLIIIFVVLVFISVAYRRVLAIKNLQMQEQVSLKLYIIFID